MPANHRETKKTRTASSIYSNEAQSNSCLQTEFYWIFDGMENIFIAITSNQKLVTRWKMFDICFSIGLWYSNQSIHRKKRQLLCVRGVEHRISHRNTKRTHTHTRLHLFQFSKAHQFSSHLSFIATAVEVAAGLFNSSSFFGILMAHFSRIAYFSMQLPSLVREQFFDSFYETRNEQTKKKQEPTTRNEIEKVRKKNSNDKTATQIDTKKATSQA